MSLLVADQGGQFVWVWRVRLRFGPTSQIVFDIDLLAGRLIAVTGWLRTRPDVTGLPVGYLGATTGAAAALWAAAEPGAEVAAVVSCGGRPELANARLGSVTAPTLLIVGGNDDAARSRNRGATIGQEAEDRDTSRLAEFAMAFWDSTKDQAFARSGGQCECSRKTHAHARRTALTA